MNESSASSNENVNNKPFSITETTINYEKYILTSLTIGHLVFDSKTKDMLDLFSIYRIIGISDMLQETCSNRSGDFQTIIDSDNDIVGIWIYMNFDAFVNIKENIPVPGIYVFRNMSNDVEFLYGDPAVTEQTLLSNRYEEDYTWYWNPITKKEINISDPYFWTPLQRMLVTISVPIVDIDRDIVIAVVGMDLKN